MTLDEAVCLFVQARTGEVAESTLGWYRARLKPLTRTFGERDIGSITTMDLYQWRAGLFAQTSRYEDHPTREPVNSRGPCIHTLHAHVRAARELFGWAAEMGLIDENPMAPVKPPKLPKNATPKAISEEDVTAILEAARDDLRDYALVLFLENTGCRREGVVTLLVENVDTRTGRCYVTEKGQKTRAVFLRNDGREAVQAWLDEREEDSPYVFTSQLTGDRLTENGLNQVIKRLAKRAGVEGRCNPHSFRHRFARELTRNGAGLKVVADLMGHESVETTARIYAVFGREELAELYERYSPKREKK
jgi:integrase/recombinase XerD